MIDFPYLDDNRFLVPKELLRHINYQLQLKTATTKGRASDDAIALYLKDYFEKSFENDNPNLYKNCLSEKIRYSESTYVRAIKGGKGNEDGNIKYSLLDFLCYVCWSRTLMEAVLNQPYSPHNSLYSVIIPEYALDEINAYTQSGIIQREIEFSVEEMMGFKILDNSFWQSFIIEGEEEQIAQTIRYYTHTDSTLAFKVIANDRIVPPNDFFFVKDSDGNAMEGTMSEILNWAQSQKFSLLKILSDGGVGKTTFLYWLAFRYSKDLNFVSISYLDKSIYYKIIVAIKSVAKQNSKPIVFLIDNAARESLSTELENFIQEVKSSSISLNIVFVLAERLTRYNAENIGKKIEYLFSGNIFDLDNISISKERVFENIYSCLLRANNQLDVIKLKGESKNIFLNPVIKSISESTFLLVMHLKLNYELRYQFDWEDWDLNTASGSDFYDLRYLYAIVACFFQFGIKVSVNLKTETLGKATSIDIVNAIYSFGRANSPILLSENNDFLELRHEHIAFWFLSYPKNEALSITFFRNFKNEINNIISAKLLRKIRKAYRTDEFKNSFLAHEFTFTSYVNIIDQYLNSLFIDTLERVKMLNEKGMAYLTLKNEQNAINSFEEALKMDSKNNYAKDQLARIFNKNPKTYYKSLALYNEIYKNDGQYALRHIYSLIKKCKNEGIQIKSQDNLIFSTTLLVDLAKLYLDDRLYEESVLVLDSILEEEYTYIVAEMYNLNAHYLPFASETILTKGVLYQKAIEVRMKLIGLEDNFKFEIDYAVFLYRITRFTKSTVYLRSLQGKFGDEQFEVISDLYTNKVRAITKFFFADIPSKDNIYELEKYLYKKCKKAAQIINRNEKNMENVIRGIVMLHTVRYHSRVTLPNVFEDATLQLGYAYTYHAEKPINNLSTIEIRTIAENYYDTALEIGASFSFGDSLDMIRNLQNYKSPEKSVQCIRLINYFLNRDRANRICPGFYRMRGNAQGFLGNYEKAINDYREAERLIPKFRYKEVKDHRNDQAFLFNNMASLICDMFEKGIVVKDYNLTKAKDYSKRALQLNPTFEYGILTEKRIESLMK